MVLRRTLLDDSELLLVYFFGENAGYVVAISDDDESLVELTIDDEQATTASTAIDDSQTTADKKWALATFGSGCFWCTEAVFEGLKGVESVESGYAGGHVKDPTYAQICTGTTGHAECAQIKFDPSVISYPELLEVFWRSHDPTTKDRQGNDVGPQYRSIIFSHDPQQQQQAEKYMKKLNEAKVFGAPIVTEIEPMKKFYPAEVKHQDYYRLNGRQPYCTFVIKPKVDKIKKIFADKLKEKKP